jgi:hypothetical protein
MSIQAVNLSYAMRAATRRITCRSRKYLAVSL